VSIAYLQSTVKVSFTQNQILYTIWSDSKQKSSTIFASHSWQHGFDWTWSFVKFTSWKLWTIWKLQQIQNTATILQYSMYNILDPHTETTKKHNAIIRNNKEKLNMTSKSKVIDGQSSDAERSTFHYLWHRFEPPKKLLIVGWLWFLATAINFSNITMQTFQISLFCTQGRWKFCFVFFCALRQSTNKKLR